MSPHRDVAARLERGLPAVDVIAEYVWASGLLGYHHGDLTGQPDDVHRWYESELGLDLDAVESDRAALLRAVSVGEQVLRRQEDLLVSTAEAWRGGGGDAGREFLVRHAAASEQVVAALRAAAGSLAELGDSLWAAVDRKAAAAVDIEGRAAAQRESWLAAARTVRTGMGDRDVASELVNQEITPFVATQVAGDWLAAMRAATDAVADAYDTAVRSLRSVPTVTFGVPGRLGPGWVPPDEPDGSASVSPVRAPDPPAAGMAPQAPTASPGAHTIPSGFAPLSAADPVGPPGSLPLAAPAPAVAQPDLGGGLSGLSGAGLAGLGQRLADMFGGLIGSAGAATPSDMAEPLVTSDRDVPVEHDPGDAGDKPEDDKPEDDGGTSAEESDPAEEDAEPAPEQSDEPTVDGVEPPQAPAPVQAPPVEAPMAQPVPVAAAPESAPTRTPCEIAADELPQVGG